MNPWTGLLESLHSALIDELTARSPKPKPELGMPCRYPHFELPPEHVGKPLGSAVMIGVELGDSPGFVSVISNALPARELWEMILRRAGGEFMRRGIQPRFSPPEFFDSAKNFNETGMRQISRLIWIPFKIKEGEIFLGIATFSN